MSADLLRALARGVGMAILSLGMSVGGGQYGAWDLVFSPLWMLVCLTGFEYWWRRRRARAAAAAGLPQAPPGPAPGVRRVVLGSVLVVVLGSAVMCGLLAWWGRLQREAYVIMPVAMLLMLGVAWGFEVLARRRDAAAAASR